MGTTTPKFGLYKPAYDEDGNVWWDDVNANFDILDAAWEDVIPGENIFGGAPWASYDKICDIKIIDTMDYVDLVGLRNDDVMYLIELDFVPAATGGLFMCINNDITPANYTMRVTYDGDVHERVTVMVWADLGSLIGISLASGDIANIPFSRGTLHVSPSLPRTYIGSEARPNASAGRIRHRSGQWLDTATAISYIRFRGSVS